MKDIPMITYIRLTLIFLSFFVVLSCGKNIPHKGVPHKGVPPKGVPKDSVVTITKNQIGLSPSEGFFGDLITLTGQRFIGLGESISVTFSENIKSEVRYYYPNSYSSPDTIICVVPKSAQSGRVQVRVRGNVYTAKQIFTVLKRPSEPSRTVYVVGDPNTEGAKVQLWANEKLINVGDPVGHAYSIALSGNDTYIAGSRHIAEAPTYWINSEAIDLPTEEYPMGSSQAVVQVGSDTYFVGKERIGMIHIPYPVYWKNGRLHRLPLVVGYGSDGTANSIAVSGSDIYIAGQGQQWKYYPSPKKAELIGFVMYWKNGTPDTVTNKLFFNSQSQCIAVSGNDVYIGGYQSNGTVNVARYWKNKVKVDLTDGTKDAAINSIQILGSDIYAAGFESNGTVHIAKYWKNGKEVDLTDGTKDSKATSIIFHGADIYVAGVEGNVAKYWKNGVPVSLENGTGYTASALIIKP